MARQESELFQASAEQRWLSDPVGEIKRALGVRSGPNGTIYREENFTDFSLDGKSIEILRSLTDALRINKPVLLIGETAIGKTKAVQYLSFITNTRVKRVSISSQTDVTEFMGKWVPAKEGWEWQDGAVPQAMEWNNGEGCWLYLDEISAANPGVLVKLNPALEEDPMLEIDERAGENKVEKIVIGGPNYRVIATTNPAEYLGRIPLGRDLLSRFWVSRIPDLNEEQLIKRLKILFKNEDKGEQIARVLAEFHFKITKLLEEGRIGADERIEFTFADLVTAKEFIVGSSNPRLLEGLQEAVSAVFCRSFWEESERRMLREEFATTVAALHGIDDQTRRVGLNTSDTRAVVAPAPRFKDIWGPLTPLPSEEGASVTDQQGDEEKSGEEKPETINPLLGVPLKEPLEQKKEKEMQSKEPPVIDWQEEQERGRSWRVVLGDCLREKIIPEMKKEEPNAELLFHIALSLLDFPEDLEEQKTTESAIDLLLKILAMYSNEEQKEEVSRISARYNPI